MNSDCIALSRQMTVKLVERDNLDMSRRFLTLAIASALILLQRCRGTKLRESGERMQLPPGTAQNGCLVHSKNRKTATSAGFSL